MVGTWRAGLTLASVPTPARAMPVPQYQAQLNTICTDVGAELLLVDDAYTSLVPPLDVPTIPCRTCMTGSGRGRTDAVGDFVQFTSGSTRSPQGVRLDLVAVAANVLAILEALDPVAGDRVCSWLPLSHDMGLIGLCLAPWVGAGPTFAGEGRFGAGPSSITFLAPGTMPKTSSGKIARARVRQMLSADELTTTAHFAFRPNDKP